MSNAFSCPYPSFQDEVFSDLRLVRFVSMMTQMLWVHMCSWLMYPESTVSFYSPTMFWPYSVSNTSSMMTVKIKRMEIDVDIWFTAGYSIVGKRGICLLFIYYWAHYFIIIFIDSFIYSLTHLGTVKSTEFVDSCRVSTLALPILSYIWCWKKWVTQVLSHV